MLRLYLETLGGIVRLGADAVRQCFRPPFERELWMEQFYSIGVRSLTITNVTLLFTGMVLTVQTAYSLRYYGGQAFVGDIVALSVVLELGPVLTALMVAGRVGAGVTAELGSMAVTEQIDALRALAANPVRKLVVPRIGALVITVPMMATLAIAVALFGGVVLSVTEVGQTPSYFLNHVYGALTVADLVHGVGKTVFFAFQIGVIACFNGIRARGGADGVGKATTNTVVVSSISIIIANFFLTKIFLWLWP